MLSRVASARAIKAYLVFQARMRSRHARPPLVIGDIIRCRTRLIGDLCSVVAPADYNRVQVEHPTGKCIGCHVPTIGTEKVTDIIAALAELAE